MGKMKLSVKLIGGFLAVSLIALVVGFIGSTKVQTIAEADSVMYEINTKPLGNMGDVATTFQKMRGFLKDIFISKYLLDKSAGELSSRIKELDQETQSALAKFEESVKTADVRKECDALKAALTQYYPVRDRIIGLALEGKKEEALTLMMSDGAQVAKQAEGAIKSLFELNIAHAGAAAQQNGSTARSAVLFTWLAAGIGTALALLLGIFLSMSVTRPINRVVEGLTEASDQVGAASGQVSTASQQLAEGASEQAASIEETSSSLEQMSSMTKQNAGHANQANSLMTETQKVVSQANESMNQLTGSMAEISRSSEETSKIIKTIDEIAFQTNLLALNAAVEAARAGEAGAGFAVVADEVRNLAMRAADAAKNTAGLIEGTVKRVKEGSDLVQKTSVEFSQVASSAEKMGELVGEITVASNEQAQGIEQINKAVSEMDKVVQQNAASAEESASASEEMNAQAEQMKVFVEELAALVGGARNGSGSSRPAAVNHRAHKAKGHPGAGNGFHLAKGALQKPGSKGNGTHAPLNAASMNKDLSPENLIPFDDAEIRDF